MSTKVYQLKSRERALFHSRFYGVEIDIDFMHASSDENKGQFVTADRFIQDAVEADPRFNVEFELVQTVEEPKEEAENAPEQVSQSKAKPKKEKKVVVKDVTTVNDAYDYFLSKGLVLNTLDELRSKISEYNIEFPNLNV